MTSARQLAINSLTVFLASRPVNLFIIVITQVLFYYAFNVPAGDWDYVFLVAATLFSAAAGNVINDIKDVRADMINRPQKVWVGNHIKLPMAWLIYWCFFFAASLIAFGISVQAYFYVTCIQVLLFIYSMWIIKLPLLGNVLVSALTAMVVVIIPLIFPGNYTDSYKLFAWISFPGNYIDSYKLLVFIVFGLNFIREVIKDIQDIEGDKASGRYTLPVIMGQKSTLILLSVIVLGVAIALDVVLYDIRNYVWDIQANKILVIAFIILLQAPLHVLAFLIVRCLFRPGTIKIASIFLKLLMFGGLSWWALSLFVI